MIKSELIAVIAMKTGLKNTEPTKVVEAVFVSITKIAAKGERWPLYRIWYFKLVKRATHQGHNPRAQALLKISAIKAPKFRAGKEFKEADSIQIK